MTEEAKRLPETVTGDAPAADAPAQVRRRLALGRLGLSALAIYSAPTVFRIETDARAALAPDCVGPPDFPPEFPPICP